MGLRKTKKLTSVPGFVGEDKPTALTEQEKAILMVEDHILQNRADVDELESGDVYLVSFSYLSHTWVAWIGTTLNDKLLYQVFGGGLNLKLHTYEEIETKEIRA